VATLISLPMFYSRDSLSSGLASDRAAKIMQVNEVFCDLINQLYAAFRIIKGFAKGLGLLANIKWIT
jgi:hypothetical protein